MRRRLEWGICMRLKENGLLAEQHNIIRLATPLTLSEEQLLECADIIIKGTVMSFPE